MNKMIDKYEVEQLLKQIKKYRNDMVAHNYPHQQISDIITKWENRTTKTISEESQAFYFLTVMVHGALAVRKPSLLVSQYLLQRLPEPAMNSCCFSA